MSEDLDTDALRARTFSTARRGFDRDEVEAFQQQVIDNLVALQSRIREMDERLSQVGITDLPDLKQEFDTVGEDVREILQSARDAAADMRDRARADADKWREEATADASEHRDETRRQSEVLRRTAWETSESMLTQVVAQIEVMTAKAHEDVLFVRAEAEREALRLTGDARRDAEEMVRSARADSEKIALDARNEAEGRTKAAEQAVLVAEERVQTLEQRRQELFDELEVTRQSLADLEDHIEGRRSTLTHATTDPAETSVRVLADTDPSDVDTEDWLDDDATVRLLPAPPPAPLEPVDADELAAEVESLRSLSPPIIPLESPRHGLELVTGGSESSAESASLDFEITGGDTLAAADASATAELTMVGGRGADAEFDTSIAPGSAPKEEPPELEEEPESEPTPEPESAPGPEPKVAESKPEPEPEPEPAAEPEPEPDPDPEPESQQEAARTPDPGQPHVDDIDGLFASLREPQPEAEPASEAELVSEPEAEAAPAPESASVPETEPEPPSADDSEPKGVADASSQNGATDPWELRDRLVLPVTNEALRGIKRAIVDAQNEVLEELRTGPDNWHPKRSMFEGVVGPEASAVAARSYQAGVAAAGELAGVAVPELPDGSSEDLSSVVTDLWETTVDAVEASAGGSSRERGASVGRVFRAWRTEEAERRVRRVAHSEYNAGVAAGLAALGIDYSLEPLGRDLADPDAVVIPGR